MSWTWKYKVQQGRGGAPNFPVRLSRVWKGGKRPAMQRVNYNPRLKGAVLQDWAKQKRHEGRRRRDDTFTSSTLETLIITNQRQWRRRRHTSGTVDSTRSTKTHWRVRDVQRNGSRTWRHSSHHGHDISIQSHSGLPYCLNVIFRFVGSVSSKEVIWFYLTTHLHKKIWKYVL